MESYKIRFGTLEYQVTAVDIPTAFEALFDSGKLDVKSTDLARCTVISSVGMKYQYSVVKTSTGKLKATWEG